jgi:hypothetical protein
MINRKRSTFKIQLEQEEQERIGNKVKQQKEIPSGEASIMLAKLRKKV